MYPVKELTPKQKEIYHTIRDRIDSTYSIDILIRKFRKRELRRFLEDSEKLPDGIINHDKGLARRLTKVVVALARKGGLRGD